VTENLPRKYIKKLEKLRLETSSSKKRPEHRSINQNIARTQE
jgi:hypothetical protein